MFVAASAGNMGAGLASVCQKAGIKLDVVVPEHAPEAKLSVIRGMGGDIHKVNYELLEACLFTMADQVSWDDWWNIITSHKAPVPGHFVHPVCSPEVIAGNATVGLEIIEDLPEVDVVLVRISHS